MNKSMISKNIALGLGTLSGLALSQNAFAISWDRVHSDAGATMQEKLLQQSGNINESMNKLFQSLDDGLVFLNEDVGLLEVYLTAAEAKTSPIIQMTRSEPVIMAVEDAEHSIATIQMVTSQRHSDGSATIRQKTISPSDFTPISQGGMLTDAQYNSFISAYGNENPMRLFGNLGDHSDHVWYGTSLASTQAVMGALMQFTGSTHAYYVLLEPDVETWTTSRKRSGGLRREVTTHVRAHIIPHWYFLTPTDIATGSGGGTMPVFLVENDNGDKYYFRGGVNSTRMGRGHNFNSSKEEIHYEKQSKTGWTGFAMILITAAIGVATAGAGLAPMGMVAAGATGAGVGLAGLTLGNVELHQVVATNPGDLLVKSSLGGSVVGSQFIDRKNLENKSNEFGNRWRTRMQDSVKSGPIDGNRNFNRDMRTEMRQWDRIADPNNSVR